MARFESSSSFSRLQLWHRVVVARDACVDHFRSPWFLMQKTISFILVLALYICSETAFGGTGKSEVHGVGSDEASSTVASGRPTVALGGAHASDGKPCNVELNIDQASYPDLKLEFQRLKQLWCLIASKHEKQLKLIEVDEIMNVGVQHSGAGFGNLKIGLPVLRAIQQPKYRDALPFILAHELGHVDCWQRVRRAASVIPILFGVPIGLGAVVVSKGKVLRNPAAALFVLLGSPALSYMAFSAYMQDEIDADTFALHQLTKLNLDASTSADAFIRLTKAINADTQEPNWLDGVRNPHPSIQRREESIRKWMLLNKQ